MRSDVSTANRGPAGPLLMHGIVGGIIAGIVFAMAEMLINLIFGRPFFGPLRLISSIGLGTAALDPSYSLMTVGIVGLIIHMMLSAVYGVIFVYLLFYAGHLNTSPGLLLVFGSLFGLALWVVNFLVIAPFTFPQFTQVDQFWNGFLAHTFFYGTVLGAYVVLTRPSRVAAI